MRRMPKTQLKNAVPYEEWIGEVDGDFAWKSFDEKTAAGMCYTSGTTGHPKGVVYSHRSNVLHSMMAMAPDAMGMFSRDVVLPVVPMFHANCWRLCGDFADDRRDLIRCRAGSSTGLRSTSCSTTTA